SPRPGAEPPPLPDQPVKWVSSVCASACSSATSLPAGNLARSTPKSLVERDRYISAGGTAERSRGQLFHQITQPEHTRCEHSPPRRQELERGCAGAWRLRLAGSHCLVTPR